MGKFNLKCIILFSCLFTLSIFIASCAYQTATSYNPPSNANTLILNQVISPQTKISVPPFISEIQDKQLSCRPGYPISLTPKQAFSSYIHKALIDTLKANHSYNPHSNIQIIGQLKKLEFDAGIFNIGSWNITMRFKGQGNTYFEVADRYDFAVNIQEKDFCKYIVEAFPSATQHFIGTLFKNPNFAKLVGGKKIYRN